MRDRISSAHVLALIAIVLALGGNAVAFTLGKNSVGTKQLKKNSVTTAKIKKQAVTAAKVRKGTLTGKQINAATLGTVPVAQTANTIAAPEGWHEVGMPGEPAFQGEWHNAPGFIETVAFYKDQEGVVHLKGTAVPGTSPTVFQLPSGYRPAAGRTERFAVGCSGGPCAAGTSSVIVAGPNTLPGFDGAIVAPTAVSNISLDGVTFRAGS
jgi:hypothetical protein